MAEKVKTRTSVGAVIRRKALERVDDALARTASAPTDPHEAVHAARQTFKGLRALLALARDSIGEDIYRSASRRYRDAGRVLAGARDTRVAVDTLDRIERLAAAGATASTFPQTRHALVASFRTVVDRDLGRECALDAATALVAASREHVVEWTSELAAFAQLGDGLRRAYRAGRRGLATAVRDPAAHNFHEWRKPVKRLWHQLELLGPFCPNALAVYARELRRLSDLLNDSHDLAVLRARVLEPDFDAPRTETTVLVASIDGLCRDLEREAVEWGGPLYAMTAREFATWIESRLRKRRARWESGRPSRRLGAGDSNRTCRLPLGRRRRSGPRLRRSRASG
jgi:CHAD domain-containing protein